MHLFIILAALTVAWLLRSSWSPATGSWKERWAKALAFFLFPPLLLVITGIAVLCMGPQGKMLGVSAGWFSYLLSLGFLVFAGVLCLKLAGEGWRSVRQVRTYPQQKFGDRLGRILDSPILFSANVGFWQPELVVSQGLLHTLDLEHLDAVLAHETAHYYYRDTFWFFWLGWMRQLTAWLPHTTALWEELLTLREIRADCRAARQVDPLLLAESLILVVGSQPPVASTVCAAFSCVVPQNRLTQRVEALLAQPEPSLTLDWWTWAWLLLAFLPLLTVPLHS